MATIIDGFINNLGTIISIIASFFVALFFYYKSESKNKIYHFFINNLALFPEYNLSLYNTNRSGKIYWILRGGFVNMGRDIEKGDIIFGLQLPEGISIVEGVKIKPSDSNIKVCSNFNNNNLRFKIESSFLKGDFFVFSVVVESIVELTDSHHKITFYQRLANAYKIRSHDIKKNYYIPLKELMTLGWFLLSFSFGIILVGILNWLGTSTIYNQSITFIVLKYSLYCVVNTSLLITIYSLYRKMFSDNKYIDKLNNLASDENIMWSNAQLDDKINLR